MKKMARVAVVAVILATLCIGQSAVMAAPIRGAQMANSQAADRGIFERFANALAALWGTALWGGHAALWGGHAALWGGH